MSRPSLWVGWYALSPPSGCRRVPPASAWHVGAEADSYRECLRLLARVAPAGSLQAVLRRGTHPTDGIGTSTAGPAIACGRGRPSLDGPVLLTLAALDGPRSRGQIAEAAGASAQAVGRALKRLLAAGQVRMVGPRPGTGRGRFAQLWEKLP